MKSNFLAGKRLAAFAVAGVLTAGNIMGVSAADLSEFQNVPDEGSDAAVTDVIGKEGSAEVEKYKYEARIRVNLSADAQTILSIEDNGTAPGGRNTTFWNKALSGITPEFVNLSVSSVDAVDTVSGATYSSNAVKAAVQNALASAGAGEEVRTLSPVALRAADYRTALIFSNEESGQIVAETEDEDVEIYYTTAVNPDSSDLSGWNKADGRVINLEGSADQHQQLTLSVVAVDPASGSRSEVTSADVTVLNTRDRKSGTRVYYGTAVCPGEEGTPYTVKVKVTVIDGQIVSVEDNGTIDTMEGEGDYAFWEGYGVMDSEGMPSILKGKTFAEVVAAKTVPYAEDEELLADAVSGATLSSNAVKYAVINALSSAPVSETENQVAAPKLAADSFVVMNKSYTKVDVEMTAEEGLEIHYTVDGSDPTITSAGVEEVGYFKDKMGASFTAGPDAYPDGRIILVKAAAFNAEGERSDITEKYVVFAAKPYSKYTGNVYSGEADGIKAEVAFGYSYPDGYINGIKLDDESQMKYAGFLDELTAQVCLKQTTEGIAVAGHEEDSRKVLAAVEAALKTIPTDDSDDSGKTEPDSTSVTYSGSARVEADDEVENGYNVTADVTVKDGKIAEVKISSDNTDEINADFLQDAVKGMADKFAGKDASGSVAVDVVSYATKSSNAINQAVKKALEPLNGGSSDNTDPTNPDPGSKDPDTKDPVNPDPEIKDADPVPATESRTYKGTDYVDEHGGYNVTADVTVADGKITDVKITTDNTNSKNSSYITRAINGMVSKFTGKSASEKVAVDVVSKATKTSRGINNAVNAALSQLQTGGSSSDSGSTGGGTGSSSGDSGSSGGSGSTEVKSSSFRDGKYSASQTVQSGRKSFRITVEVKIEDQVIDSISIDEGNASKSDKKIIEKIEDRYKDTYKKKSYTQYVNTPAPSAYGSQTISQAVQNAMEAAVAKAVVTETKVPDTKEPSNPDPEIKDPGTQTPGTEPDTDSRTYKGTDYVDEHGGYNVTADVTVSGGKITGVKITTDNTNSKNSSYITRAVNGMTSAFTGKSASEKVSVDVVSKATKTSRGINNAVNAALAQLQTGGSSSDSGSTGGGTGSSSGDSGSSGGSGSTEVKSSSFRDGKYTAKQTVQSGRKSYSITVEVKIKDKVIDSISIDEGSASKSDKKVIEKLEDRYKDTYKKKSYKQYLNTQAPSVSGSQAINQAVKKAMEDAVAKAIVSR